MTRRRLTDILTVFLGFLYVAAGVAETTRAVVTDDGGIPYWFGSLVGGGAMILLGSLVFRNRLRLSSTFIVLGSLAGVIATTWLRPDLARSRTSSESRARACVRPLLRAYWGLATTL